MFLCATGTVEICVDMSFRKMLNFIAFKRFIPFSVQSFNEYHFLYSLFVSFKIYITVVCLL